MSSDAAHAAARGAGCVATLGASHCAARVAIVYTNGPERRREAVFGDLCTLLRPTASPPAARATPVSQQCTQMPRNGVERPFSAICVHYCVPLRHHRPPARASRRNSVHKWPRTASKGHFRRSVYTIVSPPAARAGLAPQLSAQQCTQMPQNGAERTFSAICVHYCATTGRPRDSRAATVYTNGPERRRGTIFGHLCTLLSPHRPPARASRRRSRHNSVHKCPGTASKGRFRRSVYTIASPCIPTGRPRDPRAATVYTNGPERRRKAVFGDLCTLLRHHGAPARASRRRSRHNSVHKCPETASRGRFRRSVYTIVSPRAACVTTGRPRGPRGATVYTITKHLIS